MLHRAMTKLLLTAIICLSAPLVAQDAQPSGRETSTRADSVPDAPTTPLLTSRERWNYVVRETVSPLTLGGGTFNAVFSQLTSTDPKYGTGRGALAERFGASLADIASENFFGDFAVAWAFREDPRYYRKGEGHSLWYRAGYAISRAVVIRRSSGGNTFNFDNVLGSAMSAGFSNLYYPPASRTGSAMFSHFAIDVADNGFVNLAPEFWPDFRRKVLRRGK